MSLQKNYFKAKAQDKTYWKTTSEFQFEGYMKIVGKLLPGIFKKRSKSVMLDFKEFAEKGIPV